jgi:F-type H+-transporting ATPase subunit b
MGRRLLALPGSEEYQAMAQTAPAAPATKTEVGQESGGGHANFPPFETKDFPSQLLWLAITFGALYYFMSKKALPAVGEIIEKRKARIARDLDDAAAMQQQADAAAAAHARMLSEARRDAQAVAQAARDRLTADSDARRKTLEGELAAKLAAAEAQIAATRTQAMTNVGAIARDAASAIFERLLGRPADASAIDSAIASVKST